jgi:ectoine hydroxylase-related dioxygenase (phytanoyl-CoA dioxygenase family)
MVNQESTQEVAVQQADGNQQPLRTFGVKETTRHDSELDLHVEQILLAGYTVLADVLTPEEVQRMRASLQRIYDQQVEEIGGRAVLETVGDTFTAMCPLASDELFLEMAMKPRTLAIVGLLLGDFYSLMLQNGILNVPEVGVRQISGAWHRDIGYQHLVTSRPLGVTALFCLDDFNEETGGTRILPRSHKTEVFPSEHYVLQNEIGVVAKAGSAVVFDAMLYHRGGHNRSPKVRMAVNNIYTLPFIKPQLDLPKVLQGRYSEDPFQRRLLGYDSEIAESVLEFRQRRLRRQLRA